jgi:hypothetical protein
MKNTLAYFVQQQNRQTSVLTVKQNNDNEYEEYEEYDDNFSSQVSMS